MRALPFALLTVLIAAGCGASSSSAPADDSGPIASNEPTSPTSSGGKTDGKCLAGALHYLDDACGLKRYPSQRDRDWQCPNAANSAQVVLSSGRTVSYQPSSMPIEVDDSALRGIVPDELAVTLILIRRVQGVPYYRYLSNGTHGEPFQPWSSTKFMAAANGARALRAESGHAVGLTASVQGIPLGDLVTVIHNYDERTYSSNGLARYFHDIGGRAQANALIHDWLGGGEDESFGGNYGMPSPDLGYSFVEQSGQAVDIEPDLGPGPRNRLSSLTMAEFLKRLVLHREEPSTQLADIEWQDLRVLFYGAERSVWFAGAMGGMSADSAIYIQEAADMDDIEQRSRGQWRIFSKLGAGETDLVENAYACFPVLDEQQSPVPEQGVEFVISTRMVDDGRGIVATDTQVAEAYQAVVTGLLQGSIQ